MGNNTEYPYFSNLGAMRVFTRTAHSTDRSPPIRAIPSLRSTLPCHPHFWLSRRKSQEIGGGLRKGGKNGFETAIFLGRKDFGRSGNGRPEWPNWAAKAGRGGSAPRGLPGKINELSPIAAGIFAQTTSGHVGHPLPGDQPSLVRTPQQHPKTGHRRRKP